MHRCRVIIRVIACYLIKPVEEGKVNLPLFPPFIPSAFTRFSGETCLSGLARVCRKKFFVSFIAASQRSCAGEMPFEITVLKVQRVGCSTLDPGIPPSFNYSALPSFRNLRTMGAWMARFRFNSSGIMYDG